MTLPTPLPECVRILSLGEEDGTPVHIALVRCIVWASYVDGATLPARAMLHWTDDREVFYAAMPPGSDDLEKHDEWFEAEPDMGACWHDIVWGTGEHSSSATVCDLYLDDGSVLLAVITPRAQQERNLSECDRPAAGVTVEGDQPNDRYVEQVRATLARLHAFLASSGQDKATLEHLQSARALINAGARAHGDLDEIRVFAESWGGHESSEVSTVDVVKGLEPHLDRAGGRGHYLPAGTVSGYRAKTRRAGLCILLDAQSGGLGSEALGQLITHAVGWTDEECAEMDAFLSTKHESVTEAMPNCLRRAVGRPEK